MVMTARSSMWNILRSVRSGKEVDVYVAIFIGDPLSIPG